MDLVREYRSHKMMTDIERKEHLNKLNRIRRNRCYRKKKLEQFEEDIKLLTDLYEHITSKPDDEEVIEAIELLEKVVSKHLDY